uniref:DH domain-containing protein n=1 Tax=Tetranychus urticae TaxID=32264 RepID=T1KLW1_TETUR
MHLVINLKPYLNLVCDKFLLLSDGGKKPYLASIESLEDCGDEELNVNIATINNNAMDDGNISTNCLKLRHIERVIMEIVETERTYCFICLDQLNNLFGNIEDIFEFNSKFLSQLEECDLIPSRIAKCFVQQSKGFEVYTQYCTNYPRTVSLLTHLMTNKETAEIFRERQLFLKHSLPLGSYLLKPVQRILKYHLLLQNIVKDEEEDIDDIRQALSVMTNIAAHINEMKRKHEHAVRVQEIQSLLCGWMGQDLTTYGELVAEGSFRMLGAKAVRHLFLFEKMLLITKKKEDGLLCYKALIMCSNLMVIESIESEPFCFQVIPFDSPRTQYTFQSLMLENYPMPIPSNAKQIVMKLGLTSNYGFKSSGSGSGKESKSSYSSVGSGRRTPSAPEYLEKRKQERRKSDADSHSTSNSLHKGFKLRKSLKKIQPSFDLAMMNGSKRSRSASTDETAMNLLKREEQLKIDRRSSLGTIKPASLQEEEMNNSQSGNISLTCCDVKTINNNETIATTTLTSSSLPSPIFSTNSITTICPMSIVTCSTTTLSTTTTSSNSSLASLEKSLTDNVDGERSYWSGLRRSSSRCSARKLANDYLKRASISEACGDDYVSFYFCGNGLVRRDSINGSTSSNGVATLGEEDKLSVGNLDPSSIHGYSLSSGSSMASMVSSTASESNSIMCICKAYRQLNLRSTPKQTQSLSSSNSSSTSSSTTSFTSTDCNNVTGSNVQIVESPYDEYIPCLCGSTCEQRSRLFNSNSGEDSGLGSIFSGSSSNSSFSARTSTPLSAGSSELSMASSSHSSTDDYHHILSNLTGAVGRLGLTNDHSSSNHLNNPHNVRRAQSFTGMVKTKTALLTHTLSFRHSPQLDLTPCFTTSPV